MGLTSNSHREVAHNTMYGRWFQYLLLPGNFIFITGIKQSLADSFMGMEGKEDLCKVQEIYFYSPFHFHVWCSSLSHVALSWLAGLGVLAFSLSLAQSHLSECHLEVLLTCKALGGSSPWVLYSTTLWNADTEIKNNKSGIFPSGHTHSRVDWYPLGNEKLRIRGEIHISKTT